MRAWRLVLVVVLASGCWTQTGFGPGREGVTPFEATLHRGNVSSLEEIWRVSVGPPANAPVILGNRLVVTSDSSVRALDTANGTGFWSDTPGPLLGAPALVGNDRVIVPFARGGDDGGGVFSYALGSGTVTTSNDPDLGHAQAPAVRGSLIATIVGQQDGEAGAVGVQYGSRRGLTHCCIGVPPFTAPTLHGDRVFAGVSQHVDAFDLAKCTPSGIRDFCKPAWTAPLGSTTTMAVAVSPSEIAVGLANGQLKVLDVASGAVKWTGNTGSSGAQASAVAGNRIYVGTADGRVRAFARAGCGAATCNALWHTTAGEPIAQQPAVANGLIYVGTATGEVKAFDAAGCPTSPCPPLWDGDTETFSPVSGGPVIAGGHVYVATLHGQLIAFGLPN